MSEDRSPMNLNHGRRVNRIFWPQGEPMRPHYITSGPGQWLYFEVSYHGDRDEHWKVLIPQNTRSVDVTSLKKETT